MVISDKASQALYSACSHRGKSKGLLLAKAPGSGTLAYAAWQAAMLHCNPYKFSIGALLFMNNEQLEIYREIDTIFEKLGINGLDRDRNALSRIGAW